MNQWSTEKKKEKRPVNHWVETATDNLGAPKDKSEDKKKSTKKLCLQ